ncbi:MAG: hypothetical protein PHO75_02335 [Candidatus Shapirobacteria bacterium]|nr:hypothetical protein [Candidatus Shapirobacteria bacterium]
MICQKCGEEMEIKDVLVARTTDPKDDDVWEKMWVCDCGEKLEIINSEEEMEE